MWDGKQNLELHLAVCHRQLPVILVPRQTNRTTLDRGRIREDGEGFGRRGFRRVVSAIPIKVILINVDGVVLLQKFVSGLDQSLRGGRNKRGRGWIALNL